LEGEHRGEVGHGGQETSIRWINRNQEHVRGVGKDLKYGESTEEAKGGCKVGETETVRGVGGTPRREQGRNYDEIARKLRGV